MPRKHFPKEYICETCKIVFIRQGGHNYRFCSRECSYEKTRKYIIKICEYCHKQFLRHRTCEQKFCSPQCSGLAKKGKTICHIKMVCPICETEFIGRILPSRKQRFCSPECSNVGRRSNNTTKYVCSQCGKRFERKFRHVYRFCSHACANAGNRKGGYPKTWRGENWPKQNKLARQRDNNTCQICGEGKERIDVHHIVRIKYFYEDFESANSLSNLIVLCRHCHSQVEANKISCPVPK